MYYNSSPRQETSMNLLISPFQPDQLQYENNNNEYDYNHHSEPIDYSHHSQPLDVPIQQINNMNLYNGTGMSPVANMSMSTLYNNHRSPSPQATELLNNHFTNEFISRSPESSSSAETNLVSPPQQYESWLNNTLGLPPTPMDSATSQYNHHPATKRSSSVPPHFHKLKPNHQDSMYNQFQVTPTLHHQHHHHMMPTMNKALPIQIQRMNASNNPSSRPVNAEAHRRQLDEKLEKVNFDDITVAELKEMLRERGLSATGRKAELMNRLKEEYELLAMRGGSTALNYSVQQQAPLHRRVANLNLMDSPNMNRQQRLYAPYSPPPNHRLASSVPDSHTPTYLNDQFMMKKKPSCLRKSVGEEEELPAREWTLSFSTSPPASTDFYPSSSSDFYPSSSSELPSNVVSSTDMWDDQTLQNFLNQI